MGSDVPAIHMSISATDFPQMYQEANFSAERFQRRYRLIVLSVALACVLGISLIVFTDSRLGITFAFGFTAIQLCAATLLSRTRWNHDWYLARALAESVKSLTWRFAVCASPFPQTMSLDEAKIEFSRAMSSLIPLTIQLPAATSEVTPLGDVLVKFDALRQADFDTRRRAYLDQRLRNQLDWYATKSALLRRQRLVVDRLTVISSIVALTLGIILLVAPSAFETSVIACAVAVPPGLIAIGQSLNLHSDVSAYRLTNTEIQLILLLDPPSNECDWASWVDDKEEAISREHVLWLASRNDFNEV
jgi:hypothetical protein